LEEIDMQYDRQRTATSTTRRAAPQRESQMVPSRQTVRSGCPSLCSGDDRCAAWTSTKFRRRGPVFRDHTAVLRSSAARPDQTAGRSDATGRNHSFRYGRSGSLDRVLRLKYQHWFCETMNSCGLLSLVFAHRASKAPIRWQIVVMRYECNLASGSL